MMRTGRISVPFSVDDKQVRSRKEKRREARQAKLQRRFCSWTSHQANKKQKTDPYGSISSFPGKDDDSAPEEVIKKENSGGVQITSKKLKKGIMKKASTGFQEYLEMDMSKEKDSLLEDLSLEQKLAKRLKVKGGNLRDTSDGLSDLLEGISSSFLDVDCKTVPLQSESNLTSIAKKKRGLQTIRKSNGVSVKEGAAAGRSKRRQLNVDPHPDDAACTEDLSSSFQQGGGIQGTCEKPEAVDMPSEKLESRDPDKKSKGMELSVSREADHTRGNLHATGGILEKQRVAEKYVPPHLRESGSAEHIRVQRQIRGLLNRLSEANVESITSDISDNFQAHGRRLVGQVITTEILASCCRGPRGNEKYAAVFAAFIAGITSLAGMDFGANFIAALAVALEEEYQRKDGLAVRNLALLISFLYSFGFLASDMVFDLLRHLSFRFEELDVATILQVLQTCGVALRNQDPSNMKDLITNIQQRYNKLKESFSNVGDHKSEDLNKRVKFMLEEICEIKNNKRRSKDEPTHHVRLKKWLQKLRVEDVQLRYISWNTLLDPDKKGQWWLPGASKDSTIDHVTDIVNVMDTGAEEAKKMLKLAASQRMNTDARRAIFCVIMTGEDYVDAFEKLLRLKLHGKQDREIIRVVLECSLQEGVFNKYYALLTSKLCQHDKNHKFTLQYALWDHFKQLDSMELRRISNLARMLTDLVASFTISLAVLKVVDFTSARSLTSKVILHFRIFVKSLLTEYSDEVVWGIFTRIASPPELQALRDGLALFIHQHVLEDKLLPGEVKSNSHISLKGETSLAKKYQLVKRALSNTAGVGLNSNML